MEIIASVSLNFIFFSDSSDLFHNALFFFFILYNALRVSSREQMFWVLCLCFNEYKDSVSPSISSCFVCLASSHAEFFTVIQLC